jgi:tartronate-semialdehyde synthase
MLRRSHFDNVPIKPQRVYEEMSKAFGRNTCYVSVIGLSQIAGAQFLGVYHPRNWINAGQAGPLGWTLPAALGVRAADPTREIVALSGDYDFQFLIEELAVGAQFKLPYIHVVVNNSYLGLIRQAQRGFDMDYHVQLSFENINAPNSESMASITSRSPKGSAARRSASPIRGMRRRPSRPRASLMSGTACRSWSSSSSNA